MFGNSQVSLDLMLVLSTARERLSSLNLSGRRLRVRLNEHRRSVDKTRARI